MKSDGAAALSIENTESLDLKKLMSHFGNKSFMNHEAQCFEKFVLDKCYAARKESFLKTVKQKHISDV